MPRPFDPVAALPPDEQRGQTYVRLVELMQRLLAPDGCPWDREQSYESLRRYVLEEAAEVALDAVVANRDGVIQESVDLIYNLTVLWVWMGINPAEVWHEMERREQEFGIAGKLPKEQP